MRDDKLIEAMARGVWGARQLRLLRDDPEAAQLSYDELCPSVQAELLWEARASLAALQETHAVVPRQYEAAMASSGPRSGHSVEVLFKDRGGALEFYAALKGLGSDWVQRQLDYIDVRKKAAPQTEEPRGINVSGHTYVRRSATSYVCRRCGHDMCREGPKPCANQQPEEAP